MIPRPGSAARAAKVILGALERSVSPGVKVAPHRPVSLRSVLGIPQAKAVAQGLPAVAVMLCFAAVVFGVFYLVSRIGVWLVVALLWVLIGAVLWRLRQRMKWRRLQAIVRGREPD